MVTRNENERGNVVDVQKPETPTPHGRNSDVCSPGHPVVIASRSSLDLQPQRARSHPEKLALWRTSHSVNMSALALVPLDRGAEVAQALSCCGEIAQCVKRIRFWGEALEVDAPQELTATYRGSSGIDTRDAQASATRPAQGPHRSANRESLRRPRGIAVHRDSPPDHRREAFLGGDCCHNIWPARGSNTWMSRWAWNPHGPLRPRIRVVSRLGFSPRPASGHS